MKNVKTIAKHIADQLNGDPIVSHKSPEYQELTRSISALVGAPDHRFQLQALGLEVLKITSARVRAGLTAEIELQSLRGSGGDPC